MPELSMTELMAELLGFITLVAESRCDNYGDCRFQSVTTRMCLPCQARLLLSSITYA